MKPQTPATIEEYIAQRPTELQPILNQLRKTILTAAPEATEKISWGMATFVYHGNLVHFSAETKHIGFHPAPSAIEAFQAELSPYSCSKGTVRFLYTQPLPWDLIQRMVSFRVKEQDALAEAKKNGQKAAPPPPVHHPVPEDIAEILEQKSLTEAYHARPPYQRNGYLVWIAQAKRTETREKRLHQMLLELQAGDVYLGAPYRSKPR